MSGVAIGLEGDSSMRLAKTASVEELQTVSCFESLRKIFLSEDYVNHLDKPLAYWALPTDRRLPLAFLGRTLRDLLNTPFAELSATPGIGRKKTASFVELLARAANTDPGQLPTVVTDAPRTAASVCTLRLAGSSGFDPTNISEVTWAQWRASVVRHGLGHETLGRLAPSLRHMTRIIWNRPLGDYVNSTLAEIRAMKTHGEKRVHAILEVFYAAHALVANMGTQEHLVVRIVPRSINQAEEWIGRTLQKPGVPSKQEIFDRFVGPLLNQLRVDATRQIVCLAENRLGISGPITSVRQAARTIGLTRARVYQLLNEINDIAAVRWPTGRHQSHELRERLLSETGQRDGTGQQATTGETASEDDLRQFFAAVELFYPGSRRGADGPLELAAELSAFHEDALLEVS
jgi:hypothetical protein